MQVWIDLATGLSLTPPEKKQLQRFREFPESRAFLPLAEILIRYGYSDEASELLVAGVELHPQYLAARVILVRELFNRGLFDQAQEYLDQAGEGVRENIWAERLRLKLALVLGHEFVARETAKYLRKRRYHDKETKQIDETLQLSPFSHVQQAFRGRLTQKGIVTHSGSEAPPNNSSASKGGGTNENWVLKEPLEWGRPDPETLAAAASVVGTRLDELFLISHFKQHRGDQPHEIGLDALNHALSLAEGGDPQRGLQSLQPLMDLLPNNGLVQKVAKRIISLKSSAALGEQSPPESTVDLRLGFLQELRDGLRQASQAT